MRQPGNREWVTVIQGAGALGFCVPPFIVGSGKYYLLSWYEDSPLPPDWVIATSDNGWTTNEIGLGWIKHFNKSTESRTSGSHRLLIVDGHESHSSMAFELYCKEHNIIALCMPPHSSHLLQPLDIGYFSPLKTAYGRQIENKMRAGISHISKEDFSPAVFAAFQVAMTEKNIQGGIRGAGIMPYNPEVVLSKLDVKLETPTPLGLSHGLPQPWTSRTPNNPIKADSQIDYGRKRISRYQGSSLTSIIQAIDQFAKGTRGIIHQRDLLKSGVSVLRAENDTLSCRRRAKKTRLQQGGSITLAEGQDQQAQNEVNV
jgi:hypothetical protein